MSNHSFSPTFKPLSNWSEEDALSWIRGLDPALQPHLPQFQAHCIQGSDLIKMDRRKLEYLKVTQVGHQELMLEAIELLLSLDNSMHHQTALRRIRVLSKKASQVVQLTTSPYPQSNVYSQSLETAAALMEASRNIITWIDSNPCQFIPNYTEFRRELLAMSLELNNSVTMEPDECRLNLLENAKSVVKLTSKLIAPQVLQQETSDSGGVILVDVHLKPDVNGLGISIERTTSGQLIISSVKQGSPASQSGRVFVGDEVVQINGQNVVGWVVSNVVECIKSNLYEVLLTLKSNLSRTPPIERRHPLSKTTPPTSPSLSHVARHTADVKTSYRHSLPVMATTDAITTPTSATPTRAISLHSNTPPMSSEVSSVPEKSEQVPTSVNGIRVNPMEMSPTSYGKTTNYAEQDADSEFSSERDTPDVDDALKRQDRAQSVPPHQATSTPISAPASNITVSHMKNMDRQQSSSTGDLPSVCYQTKIIGGVVHRIPISTSPASSPSPELENNEPVYKTMVVGGVVVKIPVDKSRGKTVEETAKTTGGKRKSQKKKRMTKAHSVDVPLSTIATQPDPGENVPLHKGIYSSQQDVTIAGQSTKQVEVESQLETIGTHRSSKKQSSPELMVPCFQIKDADHEGWLSKLGGSGLTPKNWRRRWFVLKGSNLYYYKTAFDVSALGIVKLKGYSVSETPDSKKSFAFHASKEGQRTYYFVADTAEEMKKWMALFKAAADEEVVL